MESMSLMSSLWALLLLPVAFNQNDESCQLFFTVQPPPSLPCNPYQTALTNTALQLQCTVHAPELDLYLMEKNYTVQWVKQRPASRDSGQEEIISTGSVPEGMRVENEHSTYFYAESSAVVGTYVKSVLSINLNTIPTSSLPGRYWCQVLANSLADYSYKIVGRSNTETVIPASEDYSLASGLSVLPPCVASEGPLHQPYFRCVHDTELSGGPDPVTVPDEGLVSIPSSVLAAVAVAGGALIVTVLILCLVTAYSCRVVNERRLRGTQRHLGMVSVQSAEIQEVKTAIHKSVVTPHAAQSLGYQSSLPRRSDSHKGTPVRKGRMPHYSPDQQLIESLNTDTTTYSNSNRIKSTGGSNNTLS